MDKYEFNIKVEQIKKLVNKGDYDTAMKIADTIDWRRVRNANLLSLISSVYEKNEEYQEAKDILLIAFERAPIGKRLLYKLTQLALKEGNVQEAEAYYREFCELAGDDPRQDVLRYMILKQKNAPVEQLVHSLESYTSKELDEKWLYELAELYHQAGMEDACVRTCDKIMLMFGLGKYVDKAMELKLHYAPLTKYQMDLVENRDKYEAKLKQVEQRGYGPATSVQEEFGESVSEINEQFNAVPSIQEEIPEPVLVPAFEPEAEPVLEQLAASVSPDLISEPVPIPVPVPESISAIKSQPEMAVRPVEPVEAVSNPIETEETEVVKVPSNIEASVHEAEVEANLAREMSRISMEKASMEPDPAEESEAQKTRVIGKVREVKQAEPVTDKTIILGDLRQIQEAAQKAAVLEKKPIGHIMVETTAPEEGLMIAAAVLKEAQKKAGRKYAAAKLSGEKLNEKGILANQEKLSGKDLIIERAGDLTDEMLDELNQLLETDTSGMIVVLIDNRRQLNGIKGTNPALAAKFCEADVVIGEEVKAGLAQAPVSRPHSEQQMGSDLAASNPAPLNRDFSEPAAGRPVTAAAEPVNLSSGPAASLEEQIQLIDQQSLDEPAMDIDEFAQYCCQYAGQIDCSITGKSMLALYERIEIMEEEGIALTRNAAEELIEEAVDRAENPSFGKRITGLFSSKYDKDGLLVLKEEHFI